MVTPRFFPFAGGIQTHVREVGERLVAAGIDVEVLTTDPSGTLPKAESVGALHVRRVAAWPPNRDYFFSPAIWRSINAGRWDIVHCQGVHTFVAPIAMAAARAARMPYVVTFHTGGHSSGWRHRIRSVQWRTLRPLLSRACRLIAVSRYEAELFREAVRPRPGRLVVIPNGVTPVPRIDRPSSSSATIMSIGRLERYKGHHRLIEAMPHVARRLPGARAIIVGTGPYEEDLRNLAVKLGVQDVVQFTAVPAGQRAEMADLIAQADLVVLLSDYEAHPVSLLEAASAGRPVLVMRTTGLTELAEAGLARGMDPGSSAEETATAIISAMAEAPASTAARLPSWDDTAMSLLGQYEACLAPRP